MRSALDKHDIAQALRETAAWLRFHEQRSYRARAYERGAAAVEALLDVRRLVELDRLTEIPCIGPSLARQITDLARTGRSEYLERLRGDLPHTLVELIGLPGLPPKRVRALYERFGVRDRVSLTALVAREALTDVPGIAPATVRTIREGLERWPPARGVRRFEKAEEVATSIIQKLRLDPNVLSVAPVGALRRMCELVDEVVLLVSSWETARTRAYAASLNEGLGARIVVVSPEQWGETLFSETGPPEHVARVEALCRARNRDPQSAKSEHELYALADLPFIPAELRDDPAMLDAARAGDDFCDLVTMTDVRGLVHCHTTASDGKNTVEEMAAAAHAIGLDYLTITDHSMAAHYAGGLSRERLLAQAQEIEAAARRIPIRILRGTEADILHDGSLDYDDETLRHLDVIIASVHMRHQLDAAAMTERIVRALRHPLFKIWGHPLGRLLQSRPPVTCDLDAIFDAARSSRVAIEINGDPNRMDLSSEHVRTAKRRGLQFVLSSDAHSTRSMANLRFAVAVARRGGLRKHDVLNTRDPDAFARAVRP